MEGINRIFCFGEVLWDEVDGDEFPGGAPLNVAYHIAKSNRFEVYMVSRVGMDTAGTRMLSLIDSWSIDTRFVQSNDDYPTGRVIANVSDRNNVSYDILQPVAWDKIQEDSKLGRYISENACLIFGSLACRDTVSRQTLFNLLSGNCFRVFDINLRGSYYDEETLYTLLRHTDFLKLNEEELAEVMRIFLPAAVGGSQYEQLQELMVRFGIAEVVVTRGANGASYYTPDGHVDFGGITVSVADTIGCGDAFLAAFLQHRIAGHTAEVALAHAVLTGAFIAQKKGACPEYAMADLAAFINDNRR